MSAEMRANLAARIEQLEDDVCRLCEQLEPKRDREWRSFNAIADLKEGDLVRSVNRDTHYQVMRVYGDHAIVACVAEVTNPPEWMVLR